jgi:hypothetical protein
MSTHMKLTVEVSPHERDDAMWRIKRASETIIVAGAYFVRYTDETPVQQNDGTFEIHAPYWSTLDTLRLMLACDGLTIVREEEAPGDGLVSPRVPRP